MCRFSIIEEKVIIIITRDNCSTKYTLVFNLQRKNKAIGSGNQQILCKASGEAQMFNFFPHILYLYFLRAKPKTLKCLGSSTRKKSEVH